MIKPNIEAENTVLGCMFLDNSVVPRVMSELSANDFKYAPNKALYEVCADLFMANEPVELVSVSTKYINHKHLQDVIYATPTTASIKRYISAVKETAKKINACELAREFVKAVETADISECQDLAVKITDCFSESETTDILSMKGAIQNFYNTKGKPRKYIKTGFETIDKYTFIDKGDFIILGGKPSSGKTALTIQIGLNMSKERNVVYFSLETKPDKVFDRVFANLAELSLSAIKKGGDKIKTEDWGNFTGNIEVMSKYNFHVVKAGGMTVTQIKAIALRLKADVIFIDYLSLVKSTGKSLYEKVTNISMDLHTLAQQSNLTVIALSQLNRNDNKVPDMSNLRESGQIEQDADVIMLLYQPDPKTPDREIKIAKNKEGETGNIKLHFTGPFQKFTEVIDR